MREVKFRAWDKFNKVMHDVLLIDFLNNVADVSEGKIELDLSQLELLQYTGLKDKNGVEIYEGDILKITCDFKVGRKEIIFDKVESSQGSWVCSDWLFFELIDNQLSGQQLFEVIGNIYENIELLGESAEWVNTAGT